MYYLEYIIPAVFITAMVIVIYKNFNKKESGQNSGSDAVGEKNPPTQSK